MFTGIITAIGTVEQAVTRPGDDLRLAIRTDQDLSDVAIGASIACSGACLTVVAVEGDRFLVDLSAETVARTAAGLWREGSRLNLERALKVGDELGGHIVTGHVDGVSLTVNDVEDVAGGCLFHLNIIPHTADATTLGDATPGRQVNLEIDVLARYLARLTAVKSTA